MREFSSTADSYRSTSDAHTTRCVLFSLD